MLARVANLEKENVELQEQVLALKKQIMQFKTAGHSRPSTPQQSNHTEVESLQAVIEALKTQVVRAVEELQNYRDAQPVQQVSSPRWSIESNPANSNISSLTSAEPIIKEAAVHGKYAPQVHPRSGSDDFDALLDASIETTPHHAVDLRVQRKTDSVNQRPPTNTLDLEDLLN
jgi:hypothetical protein